MFNKNRNNYLMLAYIIFIFIAILHKLACEFTGDDFVNWEKLVSAVTISTFFFTIADIFSKGSDFSINNVQKVKELIEKSNESINSLKEMPHIDEKLLSIYENYNAGLEKSLNIETTKHKANEIIFGLLYVLGFIMFFCTFFVWDTDYSMKYQELLVMMVFVLVMLSNFLYECLKRKNQKVYEQLDYEANYISNKVLKTIEKKNTAEENNGQVENGN